MNSSSQVEMPMLKDRACLTLVFLSTGRLISVSTAPLLSTADRGVPKYRNNYNLPTCSFYLHNIYLADKHWNKNVLTIYRLSRHIFTRRITCLQIASRFPDRLKRSTLTRWRQKTSCFFGPKEAHPFVRRWSNLSVRAIEEARTNERTNERAKFSRYA